MAKHKETMQQTSKANNFSLYYKGGLWCCSASPTGAHHWLIDGSGIGQCKYCGERKQFAKPATPDLRTLAKVSGAKASRWKNR